jgi:hypothetical protein
MDSGLAQPDGEVAEAPPDQGDCGLDVLRRPSRGSRALFSMTVFAGIAEFACDLIRERTSAGREGLDTGGFTWGVLKSSTASR